MSDIKTERADTFEDRVEFDKITRLLLKKLSPDTNYPIALINMCGEFESGVKVPPQRRKSVLNTLHAEIKARELLGDEQYFDTVSLMAKIAMYEAALDDIAHEAIENYTSDAPMSWAEFRIEVAERVMLNARALDARRQGA